METTPQPSERKAFPNAAPVKRLVAYIIDSIVVTILSVIAGFVFGILGLGDLLGGLAGLVMGIVYFVGFWSSTGATPGKSAMKIKIVDADGNVPSGGQAFLRYIGYIISGLVLMLGYIWILIDASN